jgi:hypothetical protein
MTDRLGAIFQGPPSPTLREQTRRHTQNRFGLDGVTTAFFASVSRRIQRLCGIWGEAPEGFEPPGEVVGVDEVLQVGLQLVVDLPVRAILGEFRGVMVSPSSRFVLMNESRGAITLCGKPRLR